MSEKDRISIKQRFVTWAETFTLENIFKVREILEIFSVITASASLDDIISCKARTDKACSITNTHWDKSGGTFWGRRR